MSRHCNQREKKRKCSNRLKNRRFEPTISIHGSSCSFTDLKHGPIFHEITLPSAVCFQVTWQLQLSKQ